MFVRMATQGDIPEILAIYRPYVLETAVSFEYTVPTLEEFTARFLKITACFPWLVWEENGKILGYAYGSLPFERAAYQWCAQASIYLHPQAQGRGIGKKLYGVLWALLALQGYRKVYAIVTTDNDRSVAFHKAMGYRQVAFMPDCGYKFGNWYGTVWLEKPLLSSEKPEKPPLAMGSIVDIDGKLADILAKMSLSF